MAIRQPQSITIEDADYFAKQKITDPQQLAMLIAILDWPLPFFSMSTFNMNGRIGLDIATAERGSNPLYYLPQAELLVVIEPGNSFGVRVPPEFRLTLSKTFCGR